MPPAHGALIAGRILSDQALDEIWRTELVDMCGRMNALRTGLREKLEAASSRDFAFIEKEKGMFSFLGLSTEQAIRLREEYSVYMLDSSRINVAGVNARNIDYLAQSVASVL
jgi:aspartate aminotransferase